MGEVTPKESTEVAARKDNKGGLSRRTIIVWTAVMLVSLALVWFVTSVALPVWQVRKLILRRFPPTVPDHRLLHVPRELITELGASEEAERKLDLYFRMPAALAPRQDVAVLMLAWCSGKGVPEKLIELLRHQDERVRAEAALCLSDPPHSKAVGPLARVLREDEDWRPRDMAAIALGEIGDPGSLDVLARALAVDTNPYVRATAAWALGEIGDPRAIEHLRKALKDQDPEVRKTAKDALDSIRAKESGK